MTDDSILREISVEGDRLLKEAFERFLTDASFRQQVSKFTEALFVEAGEKYNADVVLGSLSVFRVGFNIVEKKMPLR